MPSGHYRGQLGHPERGPGEWSLSAASGSHQTSALSPLSSSHPPRPLPPAKSDSSRNIIPASSYIRSRPYAAQMGYHEGLHTRVRCIRTCSSNCPENSRCPPEILPPPPMMHPVQLFASSPPSPLRSASFAHPSNPLQTRPFPLHSHLLLPTQPVPVRSAQASYHSRSPPTPPRHRLVSPSPSPRNAPTLGIPNQPPTVKSPPEMNNDGSVILTAVAPIGPSHSAPIGYGGPIQNAINWCPPVHRSSPLPRVYPVRHPAHT